MTAYRGGLSAADRRRVERQLYEGELRGVTATSSLELGVDIEGLDAVVLVGFPGSLASLWQRAGRCGRTATADALCVLVAYPSAIDQWCMRHPERLLSMPLESVVVDTANAVVLKQHMLCAAAEQPLGMPLPGGLCDRALFGGSLYDSSAQELHAQNKLQPCGNGWRADVLNVPPHEMCNIRSINARRVAVLMRTRKRRMQPLLVGAPAYDLAAPSLDDDQSSGGEEVVDEVVDEVEEWRVYYELCVAPQPWPAPVSIAPRAPISNNLCSLAAGTRVLCTSTWAGSSW